MSLLLATPGFFVQNKDRKLLEKTHVPWTPNQDWSPLSQHNCSGRAEGDVALCEADPSAAEAECHQQTYFTAPLLSHTVPWRSRWKKAMSVSLSYLGIKISVSSSSRMLGLLLQEAAIDATTGNF